jgi:acylglycerol lipase
MLQLTQENSTFTAPDGLQLYEQYWQPPAPPKGVVLIVHGYAEHSDRYRHLADFLAHTSYAVASFDLRGHGRSQGERTFINHFDEYLTDLDLFLERVRQRHPGLPLFLLGHSMGGAIAALFAITRQPTIQGLVLSGPALQAGDGNPAILIALSGLLGRLFPRLPTVALDSTAVSRDPVVVQRYQTDPMVYHGKFLARTAAELLSAMNRIQAGWETLTMPLLVMHGTEDRLAHPTGSKQLHAHARATDKTLKLYQGLYHEIFNEPEQEQVFRDMCDWLDAHLIMAHASR